MATDAESCGHMSPTARSLPTRPDSYEDLSSGFIPVTTPSAVSASTKVFCRCTTAALACISRTRLRISKDFYRIITSALFHISLIVVVETLFYFIYVTRVETDSYMETMNNAGYIFAKDTVHDLERTKEGRWILYHSVKILTDKAARDQLIGQLRLQADVFRHTKSVLASSDGVPYWEALNMTEAQAQQILRTDDELLDDLSASDPSTVDKYVDKYLEEKRLKALEERTRRRHANAKLVFDAIWFNVGVIMTGVAWVLLVPLISPSTTKLADINWRSILRDNLVLLVLLAFFEFFFFTYFASKNKVSTNAETMDYFMESAMRYIHKLRAINGTQPPPEAHLTS
ncbi:unnamed protein product [Vitrella brassicaformis CCMP3155]|uniref:Uncharacterized protein n=2 Tax=Vitrella brassicaformis TaxID=1169539 RepID=A0A0G4ERG8_VITBC|nr:unnamed protein product [Vitrella brassicaformis CCMP3155]|eukprot:CEM00863.1 unnamed protein product [Vitrella brassicaformis CCMP3155]